MKVFVVMSNDYPDSVWADQNVVQRYVNKLNEEQKDKAPHIYYRIWSFDLRGSTKAEDALSRLMYPDTTGQ